MKVARPLSELCVRPIELCNPREKPETEFVYVDIGSINNRTKRIDSPMRVKGSDASVRARQIIREGDILVSTVRPNLNAVARVGPELNDAVCSTGFCVLRCGSDLAPGYLFAFVQSPLFVNQISELVQGALYPAVTDRQVLALRLPWIRIDEQFAVASLFEAYADAVTEARHAIHAQLSELRVLRRRVKQDIEAALNGADRIPLGQLVLRIDAGKSFQTADRIAYENELGVLKVSAVSWSEFKPNEAKALAADYIPDDRHRVGTGDVLISRANTVELVGAVVRASCDYPNRLLSDKTLRLVLDETRSDPDYIVQVLRLPEARAHFESNATGTSDSMRNITQHTIRATPIPLLKMEEQQKLAARLQALEKAFMSLRNAAAAQLSDLSILPRRFLDAVFEN